MSVKEALSTLQSYSNELNLDLSKARIGSNGFWLQCFLPRKSHPKLPKRLIFTLTRRTDEPRSHIKAGWDRLVEVLDTGGYIYMTSQQPQIFWESQNA